MSAVPHDALPGPPLPPPPRIGAALPRLRDDLHAAGFSVRSLAERLGPAAQRALAREEAVPALRVLAGQRDPAAVLLRLLVLGDTVDRAAVDAALPTTRTTGLESLGLVRSAGAGPGDEVRALVDVEPHAVEDDADAGPSAGPGGDAHAGEWWVVSDHGELALRGGALPTDHVLGVGTASMTLVEAVVPPAPGSRAADVGCGSGVQSLHLSRFTGPSGRIAAADASPRAARFAEVTLALNEVAADVVVGDLLDPLEGGFDRVVANLPFVVTPRGGPIPAYTYRDGGAVGDAVSARMVAAAPSRLRSGGIAQFLANWEVPEGAAWDDRVRSWVAAAADDAAVAGDVVDVWVVQREHADPALYAETWIADGGRPPRATAELWYRAWLDDFEARGVGGIGFGIVTMRRRAAGAPPLRRFDDHPHSLPGPLRDGLAAGLAGHDALAALGALGDPAGLLPARLAVAAGVVERREHEPGAADPSSVHLVDTRRLGRVVRASTALAGTVGACDGRLTVAAITSAVADLLGSGEGEVRAQVLPALRRLVAEGMLTVTA